MRKRQSQLQNRPYMTYIFLAICVIYYLFIMLRYGTTESTGVLIRVGANFTPLIVGYKQWWRLLTAGFIHIGFEHILMNGISLYYIGIDLEQILGHWRFSLIYLIAIIGGNLASMAFSPDSVSAGASTGIFGLFASYILLSKLYPHSGGLQARGSTYTLLVIMNVLSGLFRPQIDNWGHFGGFIYGGLATYLLAQPSYTAGRRRKQLQAVLGLVILSGIQLAIAYYQLYRM